MQPVHTLDGPRAITITRPMSKIVERHEFPTEEEARQRHAFIVEAMSWIGTPFVDQGAVKGQKGCVDCAMLMTKAAIVARIAPEDFEPRPYESRHMMRKGASELFIEIVEKLGAVEIVAEEARIGDIPLYRVAWTFSHGGIKATENELVHADGVAGVCMLSRLDEPILNYHPTREPVPREVKWFTMWRR